MSVHPEVCLPLSGLEEASLYHDAGEQGFFSLLWLDKWLCSLQIAPYRREKPSPDTEELPPENNASDHRKYRSEP